MILTTLLLFMFSANAAETKKLVCEDVLNLILKNNGYKSFKDPSNGKLIPDAFGYIFALKGKNTVRVSAMIPPAQKSYISITKDNLRWSRTIFLDHRCKITSVTDEVEKNGRIHEVNRFTAQMCNSLHDNRSKRKMRADFDRTYLGSYKKHEMHQDIIVDSQNMDEAIDFCTRYKAHLHTYVKEEKPTHRLTKPRSGSNIKGQ